MTAHQRRAEEDRLLARYARTRDPDVLDELVHRFLPLAKRLALRYRGGRESLEDLTQVASLGLVKAITRFDPDRGFSFPTFATPTILGELRRHFRDRGWSVHVGRRLQERNAEVETAITALSERFGRSPSIAEIAESLEISTEDVLEALEAGMARHALSLDAGRAEGEDDDAVPLIESLGEGDLGYDIVEYADAIAPALAELSERDRFVLHLRFVEDLTQTEIANKIGVSQMQVSRLLRATVRRLREHVPDAARASRGA